MILPACRTGRDSKFLILSLNVSPTWVASLPENSSVLSARRLTALRNGKTPVFPTPARIVYAKRFGQAFPSTMCKTNVLPTVGIVWLS